MHFIGLLCALCALCGFAVLPGFSTFSLPVEEVTVHWFALDDRDGLRMIADEVLPQVRG
jgi:hypothetical protein